MDLEILPRTNDKTPAEMRGSILALEEVMKRLPQLECEIVHHHAPGVYMREARLPAGTVAVGKIHKTEHFSILSKGSLTVWTDEGMKRLDAPAVVLAKPGIKRVVHVHDDAVWTTIHPTEETDVAKIEEQIIAKDFSEVGFADKLEIEGN